MRAAIQKILHTSPMSGRRISPTRIRDYLGCARRYYYTEVEGRREERSWHGYGTAVHAHAAEWMAARCNIDLPGLKWPQEPLDADDDARAQLAGHIVAETALDMCNPIAIEHTLRGQIGGQRYIGQADLIAVDPHDGSPIIVDYKTSANPAEYAVVDRDDPQPVMYCHALLSDPDYADHDAITFAWIYVSSRLKSDKGLRNSLVVLRETYTRDAIDAAVYRLADAAAGMRSMALGDPPHVNLGLQVLQGECTRYGGCPHYSLCHGAGEEETETEIIMGLLDKIRDTQDTQDTTPQPTQDVAVNRPAELAPPTAKDDDNDTITLVELRNILDACRDKRLDVDTYLRMTLGLV